jgi:hypothetical protein
MVQRDVVLKLDWHYSHSGLEGEHVADSIDLCRHYSKCALQLVLIDAHMDYGLKHLVCSRRSRPVVLDMELRRRADL